MTKRFEIFGTRRVLGFIPDFLDPEDDRPAAEQFNERYAHGGGWRKFDGFEHKGKDSIGRVMIQYPGDPPYVELARIVFGDELIIIFPYSWVMIVQPDKSFEISRMD